MEYKRLPQKLIRASSFVHQTVNLAFSELVFFFIFFFSKSYIFYSPEGKILHLLKINSILAVCWQLLDLTYFPYLTVRVSGLRGCKVV